MRGSSKPSAGRLMSLRANSALPRMHLQQRTVATAGSGRPYRADRAGSDAVCPHCRTQAHNDKTAQRTAFDYLVGTTCKVAGAVRYPTANSGNFPA